jgi:hypothetical protein
VAALGVPRFIGFTVNASGKALERRTRVLPYAGLMIAGWLILAWSGSAHFPVTAFATLMLCPGFSMCVPIARVWSARNRLAHVAALALIYGLRHLVVIFLMMDGCPLMVLVIVWSGTATGGKRPGTDAP